VYEPKKNFMLSLKRHSKSGVYVYYPTKNEWISKVKPNNLKTLLMDLISTKN